MSQSTIESHQKWPQKKDHSSHDKISVAGSVSSPDTQADNEALERALTQQSTATSGHMSLSQRVTTIPTNTTVDPNYEVDWDDENDPENPKNWTFKYKAMGMTFLSWNTLIVYVSPY